MQQQDNDQNLEEEQKEIVLDTNQLRQLTENQEPAQQNQLQQLEDEQNQQSKRNSDINLASRPSVRKSVFKRQRKSSNKGNNLKMLNQNLANVQKENFYVKGERITQEERIRNQNKEFIYPFLIIPSKGRFKTWWDVLIGIFVLYTSFLSPIDIAFEFESSNLYDVYIGFDYLVLTFFALDIVLNFRATHYDDGLDEVISPQLIAKNYLKSYNFYVDIISTIPISEISQIFSDAQVSNNYTRIFKQLKLFRILRLAKLTKFFQSENLKTIFQMFKMFFAFIISFHWLTCLWYFVAKQDYDPNQINDYQVWVPGTLRELGIPEHSQYTISQIYYEVLSKFDQYSYSLYSLVTLILGNDMGPANTQQVVIGILLSITGQFLMSLFFGEVSVLIVKLNQEQAIYQMNLENIEQKIKQNNFPENLKVRIVEYFEFCWQKKISKDNQVDFSQFSRPLETQIYYFLKKDLIREVPFFQELESSEILWIIKHLESEIYLPEDYIIHQGEIGEQMYFLTEGQVNIIIKNSQDMSILNEFSLKKGTFFGEVALLTSSTRTSDVVAADFCICESFSNFHFAQLQQVFPDIQGRLQLGFSHYKIKNIQQICFHLQKNPYFWGINKQDVQINFKLRLDQMIGCIKDYFDLRFSEKLKLILKPKKQSFSFYMILSGHVARLQQSPVTLYLLKKIIQEKKIIQIDQNPSIQQTRVEFDEYMEQDILKLSNSDILKEGDFFGELPFETEQTEIKEYYISISGAQLIALTSDKLEEMKESQSELFKIIKKNYDQQAENQKHQTHNLDNQKLQPLLRYKQSKNFDQALTKYEDVINNQSKMLKQLRNKIAA